MITYNLKETMERLDITAYRLEKTSKVRRDAIGRYMNGDVKHLDLERINRILNQLNKVAEENCLEELTIKDIISYEWSEGK